MTAGASNEAGVPREADAIVMSATPLTVRRVASMRYPPAARADAASGSVSVKAVVVLGSRRPWTTQPYMPGATSQRGTASRSTTSSARGMLLEESAGGPTGRLGTPSAVSKSGGSAAALAGAGGGLGAAGGLAGASAGLAGGGGGGVWASATPASSSIAATARAGAATRRRGASARRRTILLPASSGARDGGGGVMEGEAGGAVGCLLLSNALADRPPGGRADDAVQARRHALAWWT